MHILIARRLTKCKKIIKKTLTIISNVNALMVRRALFSVSYVRCIFYFILFNKTRTTFR